MSEIVSPENARLPVSISIEHAAERPDIGALVDRLAARLLGAHVRAGAEDHAVVRRIGIRGSKLRVALVDRGWRRLRQTEIQQLHRSVGCDLHVARLQVAMDNAFAVGRLESLGELTCDLQRLANRNRSSRESIGERRAFDQLEDQCEPAVDLFDAVDRGNVGMIERGEQARFAFEARAPVRIASEHRRQQLDGDIAPEPRIARTVHLTHAAGAKRPGDLEHAQPHAGREWRSRQHTTQHWHRRAVQKSACTFVRRQQRFNFTPQRLVARTLLLEKPTPLRSRTLDGLVEEAADALATRELNSSPFAPELPEEPCPRQRPITVHCGGRDAHDRCCLVDRQPAEESQLH